MAVTIYQSANTSVAVYSFFIPSSVHSLCSPSSYSPIPPYPSKPITTLPPISISSVSLAKTRLERSRPKPSRIPFSAAYSVPLLPDSRLSVSEPPPLQSLSPQNPHSGRPSGDTELPSYDYLDLLRLSVRYRDVKLARKVHALILKLEVDTHLCNALISAYFKLGLLNHAHRVFLGLSNPDVVSYSTMISCFAKSNREDEAVELFFEMRGSGIEPHEYNFVAILTACIRLSQLGLGLQVHSLAIKTGYLFFVFVSNALMGMYVNCGRLDVAFELFDRMPQRDIASWNTILTGVVKESMYDRVLELFREMLRVDNFRVDQFILSTVLVASTRGFTGMEGREIHAHAFRTGFQSNLGVNNALIGFYRKWGRVKDVATVFETTPGKDIITWTEIVTAYMDFGLVDLAVETFDRISEKNCVSYNALLEGYCHNGKVSQALALFCKMVDEGIELSDFTLTCVINACGMLMEVNISEQVHGFILKFGFGLNDRMESALLDMCTRCGRLADAEKMFYQGPGQQNSLIMWTAMIRGYSGNGKPEEAISLFSQGLSAEMVVDEVALATILGACGNLGFHAMGKQIHCLACKMNFLSDTGTGNALFSMYYMCGNMEGAIVVFNLMSSHDITSWNSLMAGHLLHMHGDEALDIWSKMEKAGQQPDAITFLLVISAYRHTKLNLVDNCRRLFLSMKTSYGIEPTSEHYASLVGVLGYWGLLEQAEEYINRMPFEPDSSVWRALLDTCRIRRNTRLGKWAASKIVAMEPQDPSTYILKSNLYSASGRWQCSEKVREDMRKMGFQKIPVRSWIIHQNKVHSFYTRDKTHVQSKDIYSGLEILILECLKAGYAPDTSFVLHEVEEQQKKDFLLYHSAKLATTYGILTMRPGKPIRVMKNVVLCKDCHTFFKYVSAVTKREIHLRDTSVVHCFLNGQCSCKDYW